MGWAGPGVFDLVLYENIRLVIPTYGTIDVNKERYLVEVEGRLFRYFSASCDGYRSITIGMTRLRMNALGVRCKPIESDVVAAPRI